MKVLTINFETDTYTSYFGGAPPSTVAAYLTFLHRVLRAKNANFATTSVSVSVGVSTTSVSPAITDVVAQGLPQDTIPGLLDVRFSGGASCYGLVGANAGGGPVLNPTNPYSGLPQWSEVEAEFSNYVYAFENGSYVYAVLPRAAYAGLGLNTGHVINGTSLQDILLGYLGVNGLRWLTITDAGTITPSSGMVIAQMMQNDYAVVVTARYWDSLNSVRQGIGGNRRHTAGVLKNIGADPYGIYEANLTLKVLGYSSNPEDDGEAGTTLSYVMGWQVSTDPSEGTPSGVFTRCYYLTNMDSIRLINDAPQIEQSVKNLTPLLFSGDGSVVRMVLGGDDLYMRS